MTSVSAGNSSSRSSSGGGGGGGGGAVLMTHLSSVVSLHGYLYPGTSAWSTLYPTQTDSQSQLNSFPFTPLSTPPAVLLLVVALAV